MNPEVYLTDLLTRLADAWPQSRIDQLMPWCWSNNMQQDAKLAAAVIPSDTHK